MADIITPPEGDFTPGAQFPIDTIAAIINAAWNQANAKQATFESKIATATSGWLDTETPPFMAAGVAPMLSVTEPAVTIPTSIDVTNVMDLFDTKYLELVALLSDKFTSFRTTYFPDEQNAYVAAENWLQEAISTGGIPTTVKTQMLDEDKTRILADEARAEAELTASFAAKRYPLPAGALASAMLQLQQKAQEEIASTSRKITGLTLEQMKFAAEKLLNLRQVAMSSAVDYIKALASGPDMASSLINTGYDAQSKLISAVSQFYGARIEAKKMEALINHGNAEREQDAGKANLNSELTLIEDRLKAMLTEAQALAQMATSLYNNVHASAGTSYGVNGT
ncbi:MAG: hypothetical protein E6Q97_24930 [Desulfurellales bacterium]|nr:MAG: hypothetical protein E6Q97_24930 [Desulfurellales bacterium]